jgi:hypothetical protein
VSAIKISSLELAGIRRPERDTSLDRERSFYVLDVDLDYAAISKVLADSPGLQFSDAKVKAARMGEDRGPGIHDFLVYEGTTPTRKGARIVGNQIWTPEEGRMGLILERILAEAGVPYSLGETSMSNRTYFERPDPLTLIIA